MKEIIKAVSEVTQIPSVDFLSKSRKEKLVLCRQLCCYFGRKKYKWREIASELDINHSTAFYSWEKLFEYLGNDRHPADDYVIQIKEKLNI